MKLLPDSDVVRIAEAVAQRLRRPDPVEAEWFTQGVFVSKGTWIRFRIDGRRSYLQDAPSAEGPWEDVDHDWDK